MKRLILIHVLVILTACGETKTENKKIKKVTEKKKEIVEVVKNKGDYNIQDLFFYREINNGNLLATSSGLFKEQMERASVFVPAGGGTESKPKFKVVTSEPNHIELACSGLNIDYYLFNYTKEDAALILIKEKGNNIRCIKYSGKSDIFSKEDVTNLFPFNSLNYSELKIENDKVIAKKDTLKWKDDRFLPYD